MSSFIFQDDHLHSGLNASLALVTPPTEEDEPVSIDDLKAQVWLDDDVDVQVTRASKMISAARGQCERWTGRSLAPQTYTLTLDQFPLDSGYIYLRKPPVTAVTSITYIDTNGQQQTLNVSNYQVDLNPNGPRIAPAPNSSWPSTKDGISRVVVTYAAGYTEETLPPELYEVIIEVAADKFYNRSAQTDEQLYPNSHIEAMLWPWRVV